jgi:hypothetical protein
MTSRRLNRNEIAAIVGNDPRAIRAFERLLADVQASIAGPSTITLNYANDGTLTSPMPLATSYTLNAEDSGALTSGVSWGVTILSGSFVGAAPTIGGTGTGVLLINSGLASPSVLLGVTARIDGRGYPPYSVTVALDPSGGGGTATDSTSALLTFNSSSFAAITRDLVVTLPVSSTEATLTAANISLDVNAALPLGVTSVEFKWQRETAPAVWTDVGLAGVATVDPEVVNEGEGFISAFSGDITCNRTETGLTGGSVETFRLVARVSGGNVRTVYPFGSASVSS